MPSAIRTTGLLGGMSFEGSAMGIGIRRYLGVGLQCSEETDLKICILNLLLVVET
jgi:hypothetical protein